MRRSAVALATILLLVVSVMVSMAQDGESLPNDPAVNPDANACFAGGSMEGKCSTTDFDGNGTADQWEIDWHFTCGWHLIRFENGLISREQFPSDCGSLLPNLPPLEVEACAYKDDFYTLNLAAGVHQLVLPTVNDCGFSAVRNALGVLSLDNVNIFTFAFVNPRRLLIDYACVTAGQAYSLTGYYIGDNGDRATIWVTGMCR